MDWEFITKYTPEFVQAGILTLKITELTISISFELGITTSIPLSINICL